MRITQKRLNLASPVGRTNYYHSNLPSNFCRGRGFVDYLSRHPWGEPVPVLLDDKKFLIASVNQISTLLGFDHLMPRYSWPQIRNKFSQQVLAHDVTYCNTIGQSLDNMTSQEIEREKRIANAGISHIWLRNPQSGLFLEPFCATQCFSYLSVESKTPEKVKEI